MSKGEAEGIGVVVFETAVHASSSVDQLKPPPGGPTLRVIDDDEVMAEA